MSSKSTIRWPFDLVPLGECPVANKLAYRLYVAQAGMLLMDLCIEGVTGSDGPPNEEGAEILARANEYLQMVYL